MLRQQAKTPNLFRVAAILRNSGRNLKNTETISDIVKEICNILAPMNLEITAIYEIHYNFIFENSHIKSVRFKSNKLRRLNHNCSAIIWI